MMNISELVEEMGSHATDQGNSGSPKSTKQLRGQQAKLMWTFTVIEY